MFYPCLAGGGVRGCKVPCAAGHAVRRGPGSQPGARKDARQGPPRWWVDTVLVKKIMYIHIVGDKVTISICQGLDISMLYLWFFWFWPLWRPLRWWVDTVLVTMIMYIVGDRVTVSICQRVLHKYVVHVALISLVLTFMKDLWDGWWLIKHDSLFQNLCIEWALKWLTLYQNFPLSFI